MGGVFARIVGLEYYKYKSQVVARNVYCVVKVNGVGGMIDCVRVQLF